MQDLWILLLLVAAIGIGWWLGSRQKDYQDRVNVADEKYYRGLNYLLNHQTDAALELFIDALEVNNQNLDTHLALGNAYRRKGEVDKAIQIHQNLLNRSGLTHAQLAQAQLELAHDFVKSGLLDRAEQLLLESAEFQPDKNAWGTLLLDVYQREQDWEKAIEVGVRFRLSDTSNLAERLSHYACECASQYVEADQFDLAEKTLKQAKSFDKENPRIEMMRANIAFDQGQYSDAVVHFKQVARLDTDTVPIIISDMARCFEKLNDATGWEQWLDDMILSSVSVSLIIAKAEILKHSSIPAAVEFVTQHLKSRPSVKGFNYLVGLHATYPPAKNQDSLLVLHHLTKALERNRTLYRCKQCGYDSNTLVWQCPTCANWNTTKPLFGLRGE